VDDAARLSIDGGATWLSDLCQGTYCGSAATWETTTYRNGNYTATVYLSGETYLVLEFYEATGNQKVGFQFVEQPLAISMSNLTPYSFDITAGVTAGETWNIVVTTTPQSDMNNLTNVEVNTTTTDNPYPVIGLTPATPYHVYAQTDCGGPWGYIQVTTPSTCPQPTGLAFHGGTHTLSWNYLGQTGWNVKVHNAPISDFDNTTGSIYDDNVTGLPKVILSGLQEGTTIYCYVQSDCGSPWGNLNVTLQYCLPHPTSVDGKGITNVSFGTIQTVNNTTDVETNNYGNYAHMTGSIFESETTFTVSVTYRTSFTYGTKIYVDWNNDYDFNDPGENVYTGESTSANPTTLVCVCTIPAGTPAGIYRLRIVGSDSGDSNPCYSSTYGAVEDYTLQLLPLMSCMLPTGVTASNITSDEVTISWTASTPTPANGYEIYYSTSATAPDENTTPMEYANGTSVTLTGLASLTNYYVWVRANCGVADFSVWAGGSFGTMPNGGETFGNGIWHGYVYQSPTPDVWENRFGTFLGYVEEPAQFARPTGASNANAWTGENPFWRSGYTAPTDRFAVRYKMKYDFPCGTYTITLPGVDDAARSSIDSGVRWLTDLCQGPD
jgi:hypothetical protein